MSELVVVNLLYQRIRYLLKFFLPFFPFLSGCFTSSIATQNTSPTESTFPEPYIIGGGCLNHNPLRAFDDFDFGNISEPKHNGLLSESLKFEDENSNQESSSCFIIESVSSHKMSSTEEDSKEESENGENIVPFGRYSDFKKADAKSDGSMTDDSMSIIFKDSGFEKKELIPSSSLNQVYSSNDSTSEILNVKNQSPKSNSSRSKPKWKNSPKMYLYIQMQLCKRETLKDWMSEHTDNRNCEEVLDFFDQIVTAVEYVHKKGVLHRDLKVSSTKSLILLWCHIDFLFSKIYLFIYL